MNGKLYLLVLILAHVAGCRARVVVGHETATGLEMPRPDAGAATEVDEPDRPAQDQDVSQEGEHVDEGTDVDGSNDTDGSSDTTGAGDTDGASDDRSEADDD